MYKGSGFKAAEDVALLRMVRKVEGQMEYSGVCQGHVVATSCVYCGSIGCWVDIVADMGTCWADVGASVSSIDNVILMWMCW